MDDKDSVDGLSPRSPADDQSASNALGSTASPVSDDSLDLNEEQLPDHLTASSVSSKRARESSLDTGSNPIPCRLDNLVDSDEDTLKSDKPSLLPHSSRLSSESSAPSRRVIRKPDPDKQVQYIEPLVNRPLVEGAVWYLIWKKWYDSWKEYCKRMTIAPEETKALGSFARPGPVDNNPILDGLALKKNLIIDQDFVVVPSEAWECLKEWYGMRSPSIARKVITEGEHVQQPIIELYPPTFTLHMVSTMISRLKGIPPTITLSRKSTIADLVSAITSAMDLQTDDEIQLWQIPDSVKFPAYLNFLASWLKDAELMDISQTDCTLGALSITGGVLAVEVKNREKNAFPSDSVNVKHPRRLSDASSASSASSISTHRLDSLTNTSTSPPLSFGSASHGAETAVTKSDTRVKGVCGLSNLGNTCFMNSALQCLSNTPQLSAYFLSGNYKQDLNPDNPLGMKGQLAEAYGNLIEKLWRGTAASFGPRDFKWTIGRFNPTFSGYMQHDSQELLAFLLDGLHEDLNRILKKPYIELPDFDGMPDHEIAEKSWSYHKARNDSIIVDLFQGQFKSRLTCKECGKVSVTFDPFMYLSLPLPIQKKSKTKIVFVPYDAAKRPVRMTVTLKKDASIKQLRDETAKLNGVDDPSTLLVTELFNDKIYKVFPLYEPVANIGQSDVIYIYELPGPAPSPPKKRYNTFRINRKSHLSDDSASEDEAAVEINDSNGDDLIVFPVYCCIARGDDAHETHSSRQFGGPTLVALKRKEATHPDHVYREIARQIERYACTKLFEVSPSQSPSPEPALADNDMMDVDSPVAHVSRQPIHTAATVTSVGGRRLEPMPDLFVMRPFRGTSYSPGPELFPTSLSLGRDELEDLYTRAERESKQKDAYEAQQNVTNQDPMTELSPDAETPTEGEQDDQVELADDEDEIVEDASKSYNTKATSVTVRPHIVKAPVPQPRKSIKKPPSTVIRQGEGIIIEWTIKHAQQVFGRASPKASGSLRSGDHEIQVDAWKDVDVKSMPTENENPASKKDVTLSDCLDEFTREEDLSEEDLWYCPRCKKHQRASKKFDLWKLPEIVVVHLKRFSHTRTWRDKIDAFIDFPIESLDLTDRVRSIESPEDIPEKDRLIYDLYGVDNHFGGLGGGHYTAYGQNWNDQKWYNFDDSHVTEVDREDVKTSAAYLLFYKRRRQTDETAKYRQLIGNNE